MKICSCFLMGIKLFWQNSSIVLLLCLQATPAITFMVFHLTEQETKHNTVLICFNFTSQNQFH